MVKYVYRTVDLKSNVVIEDLDLHNVKFSIVLSSAGDLTADLYVPESQHGLLLDDATVPGRTGLYVMRNEKPVWGGIIWKRDWDENASTFRLTCGTWESYAYHVMQEHDLSYLNTDQWQIARDILSLNGITNESGLTWPLSGSTGMLRERNMRLYDYKTVGLELEQLAGLEKGFDYTVESYIKGDGSFGRRYLFGYPRLGRTASLNATDNSLTLDYPGNLAPFKLSEDAESGAFRLFAIGAGEATEMLVALAADPSYTTFGWPKLDATVQYKDVSISTTLQGHANEDLKNLTPPINAWTFELAPDSDITISDIAIGDSAVFRLNSRRWPEPLEMIRRITEITVSPGDNGTLESVQLGLAEERTTP